MAWNYGAEAIRLHAHKDAANINMCTVLTIESQYFHVLYCRLTEAGTEM